MTSQLTPRTSRLLLPALASAALLILSFPSLNQPWAAWVALVPWLVMLRRARGRSAFWWSYLIGLLFFLGSMWWLVHVTIIGWIVLCAFLALYFGIFGWLVVQTSDFRHQTPVRRRLRSEVWSLMSVMSVPVAWVTLEFARSHLLSGFGWNLLAYSQTPWIGLIQFADLTGAWGVSFLIVLVNTALAEGLLARRRGRDTSRAAALALLSAVYCVLSAVVYGLWRMPQALASATAHVRIAVVQGNIPQEEKWDEAFQESILSHYESLTRAAAASQLDLIVWPETSVPGFFGVDERLSRRVTGLAAASQRPLLVGSPAAAQPGALAMTNSAMLVDASGRIAGRYDKLHLVPFGEFIPGERAFPWLRAVLPPIGEFVPGHDYTVFLTSVPGSGFRVPGSNAELETRNSKLAFSALICFEDIFPELARHFVREGARLLLVITNDAWFGPTGAAYQHAQASTFRAIELRVPIARAANTGWSGCIDPAGRWIGSVRDPHGTELFVSGTHTCDLPLGYAASLYLRWGDWFAWVCILATLGWLLTRLVKGRGER
ncbi:MAG: apolipoprotein N-acyltransferase [Candidatus Omnitrophica bacterium]|nr:apolipoprotein N-acyltransferase [Candidatus Omnitrophota bacterium]